MGRAACAAARSAKESASGEGVPAVFDQAVGEDDRGVGVVGGGHAGVHAQWNAGLGVRVAGAAGAQDQRWNVYRTQ